MALDRLGYDEVWFGEHHSGGYELIACPEVFIAAAAERTKHIRLGTGVVSLPYHHPLMVADRWVLLDHLTRGRVMFGTGPGALPSDAYMMGIDPVEQRRMMQESLEAILALFRAAPEERISRHSDWFTLRDAQLHIRPYTWPYPEISTAAMISPSGPRLAGALGTSLLSLSMSVPGGYAALENTWQVVVDQAEKSGRDEPDRSDWRVLAIMHLADTRDQAIDDCVYGLQDFANYFGAAGFVPLSNSVEGTTSRPASSSKSMRAKVIPASARRATRSPTFRTCSSSPAASAPCCCSATTGRRPRPPTTPTNCSPARSCRTSRVS